MPHLSAPQWRSRHRLLSVHSMGSTQSFEEQDRAAAQNFADAAKAQVFAESSIWRAGAQCGKALRASA